jgi:hypothetical protein
MRTVYRFKMPCDGAVRAHDIPRDSGILAIAVIDIFAVEFWAEVDTSARYFRYFQMVGTGDPLPPGTLKVHGTAPRDEAGLVRHLVEVQQ